MSATLTAPSKAAKTALMMTENWLRNVFPSDLYAVRLFPDSGPVEVSHLHPKDGDAPLLVVEVTDGPLSDATEEAGRHAAAGVRDLWVIEVKERRLHTFRAPRADADAKYGYSYAQVRANGQFALVAPLAAEIHLAQVCNLLPW
jgi:Uma2 family endonuclease